MKVDYVQQAGGFLNLVKNIVVHIEFPDYEAMNNWWNEQVLPEWEKSIIRTNAEISLLGRAYNRGVKLYNNNEPINVSLEDVVGVYLFDRLGNIRPMKDFQRGRAIGDFNKFYKIWSGNLHRSDL